VSGLSGALTEYLKLRRSLGFALERAGRLLPQFVAFLDEHDSVIITTSLALRWALLSPSGSRRQAADRLGMVRGFAKYLAALDARTEVPCRELLPLPSSRKLIPYIYTDADICALMRATQILYGLKQMTYATLIGLLAATGMRVGEAIALDRQDVNVAAGVLVVRHGKFGKSRELPLHATTSAALSAYAHDRDLALRYPRSPSFLLSLAGTRLNYKNVHIAFLHLLRASGLDAGQYRPRIHDLRHSFAVNTLLRWYREGVAVDARLPSLSTYLGHVSPASTYWYLIATPELLQRAERLVGSAS
jgi:integrase